MKADWTLSPISTWLDNMRLVFNVWKDHSVIPDAWPVAIVNPFTGESLELESDYPNLKPSMSGPAGTGQFIDSSVVYKPSLDMVVYPETPQLGWNVVLWDRQAQKAVAKIKDLNEFQHKPLWAPDGTRFVVAVDSRQNQANNTWTDDWFSATEQGEVTQLTHFEDVFVQAEIGPANWSPNGAYLAFWLKARPSNCPDWNLAVLDVKSQRAVDYCVPMTTDGYTPAPIWSPDSRFLAVIKNYQSNVSPSQVILIDTQMAWAASVGDSGLPLGWLASTP